MQKVIYTLNTDASTRQWAYVSVFNFEDTISRIKTKIERLNLWIINEINPQMLVAKEGLAIYPIRQILFFHPRYMKKLLEGDARALPEAPLKIVIMEGSDRKVIVRTPDICEVLSDYNNLHDLAEELKDIILEIIAAFNGNIEDTILAPPFTQSTAQQKVRLAENAWNSCDPYRVALAYTTDSIWRNRSEFLTGRSEIEAFLVRKWSKELDYRLIKELWAYDRNRIAVRFCYEYRNAEKQWFRAYGNENWEFDSNGLMSRRLASINDIEINEQDRLFYWTLGARPDDHPSLSTFDL